MGGSTPARIYPKADARTQWWESAFSRGTFSRIEKILLHTTETTGWPSYKAGAAAPTLTYHPRQRAWRQHNYLNTSARALVDPTSTTVRENRDNVIQIEIICYSDSALAKTVGGLPVSALTDDHLRDLAAFIVFVRKEYGGPPLVFPPRSDPRMTGTEYDAFRGILGHDDASGNSHWDPGAFNFSRLISFARAMEAPAPPAPTTPTTPTWEDAMALSPDALNQIRDVVEDVVTERLANAGVHRELFQGSAIFVNTPEGATGHTADDVTLSALLEAAARPGLTRKDVEDAVRQVIGSVDDAPAQ